MMMMLWSTFYLESWKRRNATVAMKWGMAGFETEEQMRPQFENHPKCEVAASLVTGRKCSSRFVSVCSRCCFSLALLARS